MGATADTCYRIEQLFHPLAVALLQSVVFAWCGSCVSFVSDEAASMLVLVTVNISAGSYRMAQLLPHRWR